MLVPKFLETERGSVVGVWVGTGTDCKEAQGQFGGGPSVQERGWHGCKFTRK